MTPDARSPRGAVLLMAHGTPESLDQMPEYLRLVRGGRPPSAELIEEMRHNYGAIGGRSPLTDISRRQRDALQARLGPEVPVLLGMRNWTPFIADAVAPVRDGQAGRVVGIPLAPQFSTLSVRKYIEAATAALPSGVRFDCVQSFHDHPRLLDAFAERVAAALPLAAGEELIFTAHSLPARAIREGDPYAGEVARTARGIVARLAVGRYRRAFQSAGRTPEPWLGLDLSDMLRHRAARGASGFLVVPIGFVCDHTEILYDIDVQAQATARALAVGLRRTESLNTSPAFIDALEDLARTALAAA